MRYFLLYFCLLPIFLCAQNVGIGTESPDASSILDVTATDRGILIPRIDTSSVVNPAEGLLIYQLSDQQIYQFSGTKWKATNAPNNIIIDADGDTYVSIDNENDSDEIRFYIEDTLHMELDKTHLGLHHGISNLSIGRNAGIRDDLDDQANTNLGTNAGRNNESGFFNVKVGAFTGSNCINCSYNTFLGYGSGLNSPGDRNTYLGSRTGLFSPGSGNVFLGYRAGENETNSNRLVIANSTTSTPLIYGEFDNKILRINDRLEVINERTNDTALVIHKTGSASVGIITEVKEDITIPGIPNFSTDGLTIGQITTTSTISNSADAYGVIGVAQSTNRNSYGGVFYGFGPSSIGVTGIVRNDTTQNENIGGQFIGANSLGVGIQSAGQFYGVISHGNFLVTPFYTNIDTAFLFMNSTSDPYSPNKVLAYTSNDDIIFGDLLNKGGNLKLQTGGLDRWTFLNDGNTGVGTSTPDEKLHLKGSLKIEAESTDAILKMQSANGLENRVVQLEDNNGDIIMGDIDGDNEDLELWTAGQVRMRIKNNGRLGMGEFNPGALMHIRDDGVLNTPTIVQILDARTSQRPTLLFAENNSNNLNAGMSIEYNGVGTGGANQMSINQIGGFPVATFRNDGNVGIGTSAPSEKLHVIGNICYTGSIGACSDQRFKKNFLPINNALASINQLNGLYYHWNTEDFPEKEFTAERQIGVIAQEVEALFPEMVLTDDEGYKSVDYGKLTPVLIEAIKELSSENKEMKASISVLEEQMRLVRELIKESSSSIDGQ